MDNLETNQSPGYYIKKKLLKNKPAVFGLVVILVATLVALLGYWIMPDSTPYANDGAVELKKQAPGFKVTLVKIRKNAPIEDPGFLTGWLNGYESKYTIKPISEYKITDNKIQAVVYGSRGQLIDEIDLVDAVHPLYFGVSSKLGEGKRVVYGKQTAKFLNLEGNIEECSIEELKRKFVEENVVQRTYLLGTDGQGRDMLSRLVFGTRISLLIGFVTVLISCFVGVALGSMAGFFRGWVDRTIMWLMTVIWSIPRIMLVIALGLALSSKGLWVTFFAVGMTMWVEVARVVRGKILELREKQYVEAAKVLGVPDSRIIIRHILPNLLGPLIVILTANFADAILIEAGLSFLGQGVQPPMPSWGQMVNEGYTLITSTGSWHLILFPSLCISILVLAFNLFGNGLRDAFDPKSIVK